MAEKSSADRLADATFASIAIMSVFTTIWFAIAATYYAIKFIILAIVWVVYNLYRFFRSLK